MNELALFAGHGGGILGGRLLGWRTVCAVEFDAYARRVLMARQDDGCLDPFPIWDDVRTFDGRPWAGRVDVVSGGFPCQDISCAGTGRGLDGERSGLWSEMARIVREVRPRFVFVENSPALVSRGLGRVLGDLAEMGYDARWGVLGAVHVGAPHKRERIWIVAYADCLREPQHTETGNETRLRPFVCGEDLANADCQRLETNRSALSQVRVACDPLSRDAGQPSRGNHWWTAEPDVGRMAHGVASRVDRLRGLGNGQVPAVAARAWRILAS